MFTVTFDFTNPWLWPMWIFILVYACYNQFWAVMAMKSAIDSGRLAKGSTAYYLCLPWALLGWVEDFLTNMILGTILFRELPQEWLLTIRLDRKMTTGSVFDANLANWLCKNLLDPAQAGGHCHKIGS